MPKKNLLILLVVLIGVGSISGCASKPAPDVEMLTSPIGTWVGQGNDVSLDIQSGGVFRLQRGEQELMGSWKSAGSGVIKVDLNGQSFDLPFTRRDLSLEIKLPGDTQPSKFGQM